MVTCSGVSPVISLPNVSEVIHKQHKCIYVCMQRNVFVEVKGLADLRLNVLLNNNYLVK